MYLLMKERFAENRDSEIFSIVPSYCFDYQNCDLFETNYHGKPIYVFGDHSAALKAWYKVYNGKSLTLISFDEHTDLTKPLCLYCFDVLRGDEEKLVAHLDYIKANLSEDVVSSLYVPEIMQGNFREIRQITNTQQISTALYMGIISRAYICTPSEFSPDDHVEHPVLRALYDRVSIINDIYREPQYPFPLSECDYFLETRELLKKSRSNIDDDIMGKIMARIGEIEGEYILDIDLDYFRTPFFLQQPHKTFTRFRQLIQNAKAITITTECSWVKDQNERYKSHYDDVKKCCGLLNCKNPLRPSWTAHDLLKHMLGLIEFELSGQGAACDAYDAEFLEMLRSCSNQPLVKNESD